MRKFGLILGIALGLCGSASAFGQNTPRVEFFGGYSYLNADTSGLVSAPRQNGNGWEASVTGNFNRWFGIEGDFSGYYKLQIYPVYFSPTLASCNSNSLEAEESCLNTVYTVVGRVAEYAFVAGPRFTFGPVFVHALIGGDSLTGSSLGLCAAHSCASERSLAGAIGGGVEWPKSGRWAVRASADYVFTVLHKNS
jgi:hypothetical protein